MTAICAFETFKRRLESTLSGRYLREGGVFDVKIIERFAKHPGVRDFAIALLQAHVLGVVAKPVFPRLSLNDIGSGTAKSFILLQNIREFVRGSPLKKHRQSNAIFNRLIGSLPEMGKHRVCGVT